MCAVFVYICLISIIVILIIVNHICIPCNSFLSFGKQSSGKPAGVFYVFAYCFLIISRGLLHLDTRNFISTSLILMPLQIVSIGTRELA